MYLLPYATKVGCECTRSHSTRGLAVIWLGQGNHLINIWQASPAATHHPRRLFPPFPVCLTPIKLLGPAWQFHSSSSISFLQKWLFFDPTSNSYFHLIMTHYPSVRQFGLTQVYTPPRGETPTVDIVFVHGLNGHPQNSWTSKTNGCFWPVDLLPEVLAPLRPRILTYGYNASVAAFTDGASRDSIVSHAETLASALAANRNVGDIDPVTHVLSTLLPLLRAVFLAISPAIHRLTLLSILIRPLP